MKVLILKEVKCGRCFSLLDVYITICIRILLRVHGANLKFAHLIFGLHFFATRSPSARFPPRADSPYYVYKIDKRKYVLPLHLTDYEPT